MGNKNSKRKKGSSSSLSMVVSKGYFSERFKQALKKWQEEGGKDNHGRYIRTEKSFAEELNYSQTTLTKIKKGEQFPDDNTFERMIKIFEPLGIKRVFFIPDPKHVLPQYSPYDAELQDGMLQWQAIVRDLNSNFLLFLKKHPDFLSSFPFYNQEKSEVYKLENSIFQYEKDGKTYSLKLHDIETIIDIQKKAETYIKYLFFEMRDKVEKKRRFSSKIHEEGLNSYDICDCLQHEGLSDYEILNFLCGEGLMDYELRGHLHEDGWSDAEIVNVFRVDGSTFEALND